jgi:glycosyltransferase involved in cell wall biosynthesis
MELERELGVRSSFNFVPEGEYTVPDGLRQELTQNGFEVGIHDLKHDGRFYQSRRDFGNKAARINRYATEWGAVGFRSAFMLNELDWLHALNIEYDASTFDTDPFEPQPHGQQTIFPFWVSSPPAGNSNSTDSAMSRRGYIELPYTLPQDSTLFLFLRENTPEIWFRKLEWIAEHGGMAMVITHPDYMNFDRQASRKMEYSADLYRQFIEHVQARYSGAFWLALPRQVAAYARESACAPRESIAAASTNGLSLSGSNGAVSNGNRWRLRGKRGAVVLFSYYPADPRPRRAAEALAREGVAIDMICLQKNGQEPRREVVNGVRIFRVPLRRRRGGKLRYIGQYTLFILGSFLRLAGRSIFHRYDFVHVHNMPDVLVFSALIPKALGAKVILDLHDPMPELMMSIYSLSAEKPFVRWLKRFEKWSISFADLVLTPNKAFRELFISRGCPPNKIQIVMNSPEAEIFSQPHSPSPFGGANGDRPFKIMYHGLIAERHGLDTALNAIAKLQPVIPNLEFHIFGDRTRYMAEVEAQITELNLQSLVHYHGYKPQQEISKSICSIDLGIIPNRRTPFTEINMPTRIFEYLAMGKPVVVPDTRGIRDYFDNESALFFEPDDPQSLSNIILEAYRNPQKAESIVGRAKTVYEANRWGKYRASLLDRIGLLMMDGRRAIPSTYGATYSV